MAKVQKQDQYTISVGAKGRLILPTALQRRAGLEEGEKLIVTVAPDGTLVMKLLRDQAKACEGIFAHLAPGVSLADELIADRREEARREDEESPR